MRLFNPTYIFSAWLAAHTSESRAARSNAPPPEPGKDLQPCASAFRQRSRPTNSASASSRGRCASSTARGHEVIVQSGAGAGIYADDATYQKAGARIVPDAAAVFEQAEMIVKVKEPQKVEYMRLKPDQILFTYLHLAPDPEQARGLMASGCAAIAYETVTDASGGLPLLAPMSEVAGRLSIEAAAIALRRHSGGRGVLMGGVPGVRPAKVVVLGGGVVGTHAARMAVGLGADVSIIDRSLPRLRQLDELFEGRVKTLASTMEIGGNRSAGR